jgi:glyoxylase-like metal-dependent hydrolase (beta-lactamase superfamily II)
MVFDKQFDLTMGNTKIELMHIGASHSPDDIQLWLAAEKLLMSGDTAYYKHPPNRHHSLRFFQLHPAYMTNNLW